MSPRAKKKDDAAADAAEAHDTNETSPKRRPRTRKKDGGDASASADAGTAAETETQAETPSEAPSKPRRKKRGGDGQAGDGQAGDGQAPDGSSGDGPASDARSGDGQGDASSEARGDGASDDAGTEADEDRERGGSRGKGAKSGKGGRGGTSKRKREASERDADEDDNGSSDTDDDGDAADAEGQEGRGKGGRGRRSRRSRSGGQRVNYRDLQSKIVPELHLLAKEVGLEDYREMEKDDLAVAILERLSEAEGLKLVQGYLEISSDGYGFLQESLLQNDTRKVIVSAGLIKQFRLRTGDWILGKARPPRNNERYGTLIRVEAVNGTDPFQASKRPRFDDLIPTFPEQRIQLETTPKELSARVIDLLAPIGRGQRGLIVAPPKAGKTTLLKAIAHSAVTNEPDMKVIVLLVDERPEEVTDFRESVEGVEVVASTFDEPPTNHIRVAEFVHERARRIVEDGGHVMILLDSITRLARANNLVTPPTGRTLSGGLDSSALHWPKRFLGAARNIRGGGSLSILATALVETGSRMDDVIFEEFKGTGNMELHLSRRLEERRIFPAIDILKSGTRREDLLLDEGVLAKMWLLRKVISDMDAAEAMEMLLSRLSRTETNAEFLSTLGQG
jgi:transcription termination factor Rho